MGQALYRKYRSKSFEDVVGQEHITKTLENALKSGRISHAYLFTGPRGVGKTSVARILAHEVNGLPYDDETIHLDIIEIDAASNRRIDEIRDLRDKVRIAPAAAKFKVYIIDEVHMLTREAFNALLKTLEEPPAHCIFILATTEAHKLPETIVSRTQRFEFKPISKAQAADHLADIAKSEKITIDRPALELLAEFGGGSFRDSISYLDQLSSLGKAIAESDVRAILGLPQSKSIDELLDVFETGDGAVLLTNLMEIEKQGVNPTAVAAGVSTRLRQLALRQNLQAWQLELLKSLRDVSASSRPQETLEIALLSAASAVKPLAEAGPPTKTAEVKIAAPAQTKPADKPAEPTRAQSTSFDLSEWSEVVARAKDEAASIYTALRLAEPAFGDGVLTLSFQFPLHQKKLAQEKNRDLVAKLIREVSGADVTIDSVVAERHKKSVASNTAPTAPLGAISNIFGSAEVMEA